METGEGAGDVRAFISRLFCHHDWRNDIGPFRVAGGFLMVNNRTCRKCGARSTVIE